jgi:hypothetical protein
MRSDDVVIESRLYLRPRVTPRGMLVFDGERTFTECRFHSVPCDRFLRTEAAGTFREVDEGEPGEVGLVVGTPAIETLGFGFVRFRVTAI